MNINFCRNTRKQFDSEVKRVERECKVARDKKAKDEYERQLVAAKVKETSP